MRYILLIATLALLYSCNPRQSRLSETCVDSLVMEDRTYYLDSITEKVYNAVKYTFPLASDTTPFDPAVVIMNRDSITIQVQDRQVVFNNDSSDNDSYANYRYIKTLGNLGYVHIEGDFYEWSYDYLVNLNDGTQQEFWEEPLFSPDRKSIISYSSCLDTEEMPNGIQYFKLDGNGINMIFEINIPDWEPSEIKWESDTSIVIKRAKLDKNAKRHFDYLRMKFKD